jgi:predicted dehydrogenase
MITTGPVGVLQGLGELNEPVEVVGIVSRSGASARTAAEEFALPRVYDTVDQMLADPSVDAIANLTPISEHYELNARALRAGKHVATEKPLACTAVEGQRLIRLASERGVHLVVSPPRMVEPSRVRARALIAGGAIGEVTFARARSSHAGPAALGWPTDPAPAYTEPNTPLREVSPYAIHQLTGLIGPARAVAAMSGRAAETILVERGPFAGTEVPVTANTNTLFLLDFGQSRFGVIDAGYSVRAATGPAVEIFGTRGTINLHTDYPTRPQGSLEIWQGDEWRIESPPEDRLDEQRRWRMGRAVLLEELARAVRLNRPSDLSADHAVHALEIIEAVEVSARHGVFVPIRSTF